MSLPKSDEWTDPGSMDPVARPGRSCLLIAALGLIAVLGSILIWRATSLMGLPDSGEPFDLSVRGTVVIPDEENAFSFYRLAISKLTPRPAASSGVAYLNWTQIDPQERDWYLANVDMLEVWITGTTIDQALFIQPKDQTTDFNLLAIVQQLRSMVRLVQLAALQMEARGDLEGAWSYYRAGLRSSRHAGMHGSLIERMVGWSVYRSIAQSIKSWADRPNLNRDLLQAAFDDVVAIDAVQPSLREMYEAEYFALAKLINERDVTTWKVEEAMTGITRSAPPNLKERAIETFLRIVRREPERSRRVLESVWANWLSVADLSTSERRKRRHEFASGVYYDPPADAPQSVRKLSPASLNSWVESTSYLRLIVPIYKDVDKNLSREQADHAALIVHLAECLYRRDYGKSPDSPQQLVGPYLKALPEGFEPVSVTP